MQFFTAYSTATPYGVVWEVRLSHICKHYLKTWFMVRGPKKGFQGLLGGGLHQQAVCSRR